MRTSKGSASWREEHVGAEKKQRGMGRKRGARQGEHAGAGEAGLRRKSSAGEAKPTCRNPLAPRIASDSGSGKLASDDCGMASGEK